MDYYKFARLTWGACNGNAVGEEGVLSVEEADWIGEDASLNQEEESHKTLDSNNDCEANENCFSSKITWPEINFGIDLYPRRGELYPRKTSTRCY